MQWIVILEVKVALQLLLSCARTSFDAELHVSAIHYTILEVSGASWLHFGAFRVNSLGVGHTTWHQAVLGTTRESQWPRDCILFCILFLQPPL